MGAFLMDLALGVAPSWSRRRPQRKHSCTCWLKTVVGTVVAILALLFGSRRTDDNGGGRQSRPMFGGGFQSLFHVVLGAFAVRHPLILITSMFIQFYGRSQPDPEDPNVFVSLYEYMFGFAAMYAIPREYLPVWMQLLPASWSRRIHQTECRS